METQDTVVDVPKAFSPHEEDNDVSRLGTWGVKDDRTCCQRVVDFLPKLTIIQTVRSYSKSKIVGDVTAGLITAIMLVPQSIAYASLAGLDPVYGLYSSILPLLVYPLFGTSNELAIGPVAMAGLLTSATLEKYADPDTEKDRYVEMAQLLAFLSGVIQILMGILRAGYVVNFLSHPVLLGFVSAAGARAGGQGGMGLTPETSLTQSRCACTWRPRSAHHRGQPAVQAARLQDRAQRLRVHRAVSRAQGHREDALAHGAHLAREHRAAGPLQQVQGRKVREQGAQGAEVRPRHTSRACSGQEGVRAPSVRVSQDPPLRRLWSSTSCSSPSRIWTARASG